MVATETGMPPGRFSFGRNWKRFSLVIDEERIAAAVSNLEALLGGAEIAGKKFLDIGCGSGLSSLAALRLGADVEAFDYDVDSVEATEANLQRFAPTKNWKVTRGSVLDSHFISKLGTFDVVYSWGVLHHTGDMWKGIDLAASAVAPGGLLVLALYNDQGGASRRWLAIKRLYGRSPNVVRWALVLTVGLWFDGRSALLRLIRGQNPLPFSDWNKRKTQRGMSVWHDLVDWVGGYPFEVAKPEQVLGRLKPSGFVLEALVTQGGGHACNEYLFVKAPAAK